MVLENCHVRDIFWSLWLPVATKIIHMWGLFPAFSFLDLMMVLFLLMKIGEAPIYMCSMRYQGLRHGFEFIKIVIFALILVKITIESLLEGNIPNDYCDPIA